MKTQCVSALAEASILSEEDANELACIGTALGNGHTKEAAWDCDDGSVGCPDCPWGVGK